MRFLIIKVIINEFQKTFLWTEKHKTSFKLNHKEDKKMYEPKPDVKFKPSKEYEFRRVSKEIKHKPFVGLKTRGVPTTVKDVEIRLKEVFIIDNRDPGDGDIYLVCVALDNVNPEPFVLEVKTFESVPDKSKLTIAPGGLAIYRNPPGKIPRFIDFRILIMESDQELRDAGNFISEVREDKGYKDIVDGIKSAVAVSNPVASVFLTAADLLINIIAKLLRMNKDDQIMYLPGYFNDTFDDLGLKYSPFSLENPYAKIHCEVLAG